MCHQTTSDTADWNNACGLREWTTFWRFTNRWIGWSKARICEIPSVPDTGIDIATSNRRSCAILPVGLATITRIKHHTALTSDVESVVETDLYIFHSFIRDILKRSLLVTNNKTLNPLALIAKRTMAGSPHVSAHVYLEAHSPTRVPTQLNPCLLLVPLR